ncbi:MULTISPECIES: DUF397 domain-containing protein [Streptomyces]|uniref:DUF397 domain-containing protein n=2 Tax=Streptomyces TaxID=1883 RepID=A0A5N6A2C0_9ACTN|nr:MULTISPECIES: DUF397 domain-containing protein [Streptomyces]KAB8162841.1 DUF397 domain-containing protein [Streptomyces mimosae]KAB8179054.1 DUF397 domain-containing protein [Streptomyces sp. 3MP-14]RMI39362.1 DUF397 domain-containing protein [Streptomyces triticirhizae]
MVFENGSPADRVPGVTWVKSTASARDGNCVELAALPNGEVAVRNSRFPGGPALVYTRQELRAFVSGVRAGEFDSLL